MNKLLRLINQYQSLTNMGKALVGMDYLIKIDRQVIIMNGDLKSDGNCCTLRELVSDLLFIQ